MFFQNIFALCFTLHASIIFLNCCILCCANMNFESFTKVVLCTFYAKLAVYLNFAVKAFITYSFAYFNLRLKISYSPCSIKTC